MLLPETDAQRLLVKDGVLRGVAPATRAVGVRARSSRTSSPAPRSRRRPRCSPTASRACCRRRPSPLRAPRREPPDLRPRGEGDLEGPNRLNRVIHTLGWPLRARAKTTRSAARSSTRWATTGVPRPGRRARLRRRGVLGARRAAALQAPPVRARMLEGGERVGWGAKSIPGGGFWSLPRASRAGRRAGGGRGGFVDMPRLKGVHYAIRSGILAAERIYHAATTRADHPRGALRLQRRIRKSDLEGPVQGAQHAPALLTRAWWSGPASPGWTSARGRARRPLEAAPRHRARVPTGGRDYPKPDGQKTFDKLSRSSRGNRSRDDQPDHIRLQRRVPKDVATAWGSCARPGVRDRRRGAAERQVELKVKPSNCVQCGAITAKGGRLTPPEGGSGPEYTQM